MKTIGITGGVGCGKSAVIKYIGERYNSYIIYADKLAFELESPGGACHEEIVSLLGKGILGEDGQIDKRAMADAIFSEEDKLEKVNAIVHPAVKRYILDKIAELKASGVYDLFILEAALLIEEKYYEILDELWYVRTDASVRRERLRINRGYSDEKIDSIMGSQLDDAVYMKYCKQVIDNNGSLEEAYRQVDELLGRINGGTDELS